MQTNGDLLLISIISTCFGHLYAPDSFLDYPDTFLDYPDSFLDYPDSFLDYHD